MARRELEAPRDDEAPVSSSSEAEAGVESADASEAPDDKTDEKPKKGRGGAIRRMTGKLHVKLHTNIHVVLHNA